MNERVDTTLDSERKRKRNGNFDCLVRKISVGLLSPSEQRCSYCHTLTLALLLSFSSCHPLDILIKESQPSLVWYATPDDQSYESSAHLLL
jgi:hypothetical protein